MRELFYIKLIAVAGGATQYLSAAGDAIDDNSELSRLFLFDSVESARRYMDEAKARLAQFSLSLVQTFVEEEPSLPTQMH